MISIILSLLCGVALFLFGMTLMGDGLKKVAGNKLEMILYKLSNTPIKGMLLGCGVTAVIQSSSATSVMVVGFVNSGMMTVAQSIGVVLGANIGTSITGWVLCLSYIEGGGGIAALLSTTTISALVAIIGIVLRMVGKKQVTRNIGDIMLGFAILMNGMQMMSSAVSPLRSNEKFISLLTAFENPIMAILVGIAITAVLQSASASVGIVQALTLTGSITFASSFPLIMGIAVGAACPVLLSSVGTSKDGKRTALVYLINVAFGLIIWSILFYSVNAVVHFGFMGRIMTPVSIAVVNTIFRVATAIVLLPFLKPIEKLIFMIVKEDEKDEEDLADFNLLEERFLVYPEIAIAQTTACVTGMINQSYESVKHAADLLENYTDEGFAWVQKKEDLIDQYADKISGYLLHLTSTDLSPAQSMDVSHLLRSVTDLERIGDHALMMAASAKEIYEKKTPFSAAAMEELAVIRNANYEILQLVGKAFNEKDIEAAGKVRPLRELVRVLCEDVKDRHVRRMQNGKCTMVQGFMFNDILNDMDRTASHCDNVAIALREIKKDDIQAHHEVKRKVKENRSEIYRTAFIEFEKKYVLPEFPDESGTADLK